jgi:elongation factor 3
LANPWTFFTVISPILLQSLQCSEWRVKAAALDRLAAAAVTAPQQVHLHIPTLIPAITSQVWDTKAQVSKSARSALLAICGTNTNKDIKSTIPAVVNAICKPSETNKAVSELMGTTFVVPVDASTLAILCPVLARALKEKLAIHKRAACIVISNMSKLVETPQAVAPFGSLLVPELQKVAANVQFEEIRDEALKALKNLTKALGDQYRIKDEVPVESSNYVSVLEEEQARVEAEQQRIQQERDAEAAREEELRKKEEEERRKFKEAMDAQRRLENLAEEEAAAKKAEEAQKKEMQKLSTKGSSGKCQGCGLKKCKKTCMFYAG